MIILDVDVDDMHRSVEFTAAIQQIWLVLLELTSLVEGLELTITDSIVTPLLASDNDICDLFTLLPSFGC